MTFPNAGPAHVPGCGSRPNRRAPRRLNHLWNASDDIPINARSHFVVGSAGARTLALSDREQRALSDDSYFTATLTAEALRASVRVYVFGPAGLVRYFEELSASWQGWTGAKEWESIEGELTISASHDGLGHVDLAVTVRHLGPHGWDWEAQVHVPVDAGAQLEQAVIGLRTFFPAE